MTAPTVSPRGSTTDLTPDVQGSTPSVRLQILGPLRVWRDGAELDPGSPQQAYLLALLLARGGQPTSKYELIDLMWGEQAPASALNVIHKYVGSLRRLLEPTLPARDPGSYLLRRGNGYLCAAGAGTLDLIAFRDHVAVARREVAEARPEAGLDRYVQALGLWSGPAGDGLDHGPEARGIFSRLDGELLDACTAATDLALALGQPERVLAPLVLAAGMDPFHEPVHASLVSALGAAGRQAEALAAYQAVRTRLVEDLGIDPGPALEEAQQRVLNQDLTPVRSPVVALPVQAEADPEPRVDPTGSLVGRVEDLGALRQAVEPVFTGGTGVVIVEGEAGVGKTRLLEEIVAESDQRGAAVVWGRCLEGDGTPSMWPWVQAIGTVLDTLPPTVREEWLEGDLGGLVGRPGDDPTAPLVPDSNAQFRLFEQAVAVVGDLASPRPVVLVIDDLQWADAASLRLFGHMASRLPEGVGVIGALRDVGPPGSPLARMVAAAGREGSFRRIHLGPLDEAAVATLVHREVGQPPSEGAAQRIHARTSGNPFFVRELSRLLAGGGPLTEASVEGAEVPATVREVVLDRLADLDDGAVDLLQVAALVGRSVDLGLLAHIADLDVQTCLSRLEPLQTLGFLVPTPGDPYSYHFSHDLVRESISETTSLRRGGPLHLRAADALAVTHPDDETVAERIAHHLWAAGPLADPVRTATAQIRAGRRAAATSALEAAERHLRSAAGLARTANVAELELSALSQLTAVVGMRELWGDDATDQLERAEHLARQLGREQEATGYLFSRWVSLNQRLQLDRSGPLARRLLDEGALAPEPIDGAYGMFAWGIHQWAVGNVGDAYRQLSRAIQTVTAELPGREQEPVRHDLQLLMTGMFAETTALHGDVDSARTTLDRLEVLAGDDTYGVTVWACFVARTAVLVDDPAWALRAAERGFAVDRAFTFGFLGTYQRLARCWALAVTGRSGGDAATEARRLIDENLLDPPRSCVATWFGLLAEMWLAAGAPDEAAAALDRAELCLDTYGQRYPEGLILLLRARLLHARGAPVAEVRAAAEDARALSTEREAHLFARRAEAFLAELDGGAPPSTGPPLPLQRP